MDEWRGLLLRVIDWKEESRQLQESIDNGSNSRVWVCEGGITNEQIPYGTRCHVAGQDPIYMDKLGRDCN